MRTNQQRFTSSEEGFGGRCPPCLLGQRRVTRRSASPRGHTSPGRHSYEHSRSAQQPADFGANEWLVEELYQRYLADPGSVDRAWWSFFADYQPALANGTGPQPVISVARAAASAAPAAPAAPPAPPAPPQPQVARPAAGRPAAAGHGARAGRTGRACAAGRSGCGARACARSCARSWARRAAGGAGGRGEQAARRRGAHRHQHDGQPVGAHGHQRAFGPGQAPGRQPDRDQQPPQARPRRQGLVHPPDRVRGGPGAQGTAGDERRLHRGRRQARHRPARARQPGRWPSTCIPPTVPGSSWCRTSRRRRSMDFRLFWTSLRGRRAPSAGGQAHGRGLRWHHRDHHEPGHHRHRSFGAEADARPGLHRRRRRDGVPRRVRRRVGGDPGPAGHQQGGHAHLDLRPPDHPGRPVRGVPEEDPRAAAGRGRLLRRALRRAAHPVRAGPLGQGLPVRATRTTSPGPPGCRS